MEWRRRLGLDWQAVNQAEGRALLRAIARRREAQSRAWAGVQAAQAAFDAVQDYGSPEAFGRMVDWLRAQLQRVGARGLVVGVSGGVDSTLGALLVREAAPRESLALILPDRGPKADETDAAALLSALGLEARRIDLAPQLDGLLQAAGLRRASRMVRGNLASRLRSATQYLIANATGRLVLGTGNVDEQFIGYCTKGTGVDLAPLAGLHKREVRAHVLRELSALNPRLARRLARRPASPGFFPGQRAEAELGTTYDTIGQVFDALSQATTLGPLGFEVQAPARLTAELTRRKLSGPQVLSVMDVTMRNAHKTMPGTSLNRNWRPR